MGISLTMLATGTQEAAKWGLSILGQAAGMTTRKFQRACIESIRTTSILIPGLLACFKSHINLCVHTYMCTGQRETKEIDSLLPPSGL